MTDATVFNDDFASASQEEDDSENEQVDPETCMLERRTHHLLALRH